MHLPSVVTRTLKSLQLSSSAYVIVQVDDLVEAAAGLISVIDDLRPLDADSFNAFYTIYKAIAVVPPADRCVRGGCGVSGEERRDCGADNCCNHSTAYHRATDGTQAAAFLPALLPVAQQVPSRATIRGGGRGLWCRQSFV